MNLIDVWNRHKLSSYNNETRRLEQARYWTKSQIDSNLKGSVKWWRDNWRNNSNTLTPALLKERRALLGEKLGEVFRNQDCDEALEIINRYRNIIDISRMTERLDDLFSEQFSSCDDCNELGYSDNMHAVNCSDRYVCECCKDGNYHWSRYHDCYVDDDYDESEREFENIGEYHSSSESLGHIPSKYDNRKPRVLLGLELEMETSDSYGQDERAGHLLRELGSYRTNDGSHYTYALCEQDGSLDHGFEMVTAYTGLDVHKEQLQFFKTPFKGMSSHDTSTCGLHIHICKADMTTLHGAKMVLFVNDADNQKLIYALARRDACSYAKVHDKKNDKHWLKDAMTAGKNSIHGSLKKNQLRNLNSDRYEALNFRNDKTVEFRLFKGSLKYQTIMSCLEFTFATWHFCREAGQSELTTAKFLDFICRAENRTDTRFLRAYLKDKGFNLPEKNKPAKPATKATPAIQSELSNI